MSNLIPLQRRASAIFFVGYLVGSACSSSCTEKTRCISSASGEGDMTRFRPREAAFFKAGPDHGERTILLGVIL